MTSLSRLPPARSLLLDSGAAAWNCAAVRRAFERCVDLPACDCLLNRVEVAVGRSAGASPLRSHPSRRELRFLHLAICVMPACCIRGQIEHAVVERVEAGQRDN